MRNTVEQIDHAIEIFRAAGRHDLVIGLTSPDWDDVCAQVIERCSAGHEDPGLTKTNYAGVPIVRLADSASSFVGHDYGTNAERRFPLTVLAPVGG